VERIEATRIPETHYLPTSCAAMNSACTSANTRPFAIDVAGDGSLLPRVPQDSLSIRAGLILVVITASCGLAWIVISSVTLPTDFE
jgi:hypothetical protein